MREGTSRDTTEYYDTLFLQQRRSTSAPSLNTHQRPRRSQNPNGLPAEKSGCSNKARGINRSLSELHTSNGSVHLRSRRPVPLTQHGPQQPKRQQGKQPGGRPARLPGQQDRVTAAAGPPPEPTRSRHLGRPSEESIARKLPNAVLAAIHGSDHHSDRIRHHNLGNGRPDDRTSSPK